jgi:hypothetical protein
MFYLCGRWSWNRLKVLSDADVDAARVKFDWRLAGEVPAGKSDASRRETTCVLRGQISHKAVVGLGLGNVIQ